MNSDDAVYSKDVNFRTFFIILPPIDRLVNYRGAGRRSKIFPVLVDIWYDQPCTEPAILSISERPGTVIKIMCVTIMKTPQQRGLPQ